MATVAKSNSNSNSSAQCQDNHSTLPPPPQSRDYDTPERLVWHRFQGIMWPGMFYHGLQQFNQEMLEELDRKGDKTTKAKLGYHLMKQALMEKKGGSSFRRGIVRYLGRPIFDYQQVKEGEYESFLHFLPHYLVNMTTRPDQFGQDNYQLYMDFHRGIDESMVIFGKAAGASSNADSDEVPWEEQAQKVWEEFDWTNPAPLAVPQPQPQQHSQQQNQLQRQPLVPHSPNTNSVAAVSLADESMVSANTGSASTSTHHHQQQPSWTETPVRHHPTTPAANDTPALETTPIRNVHAPWSDVWSKMAFSDWNVRSTKHGKIYTHANLTQEFTEEEVKEYVKKHYGWLGERRPTRGSSSSGDSPQKTKTFGVYWKQFLKDEGWQMIKGKQPIEWYYVRPNRSVVDGVEGEDYFISTDAVVDYCDNSGEYQSSSGSESEVSPDPRNQARRGLETDDDESTKLPPDTDDDRTIECLTPRDQGTKPQDPAKPDLPSAGSATESESEDDRYDFSFLWPKLRDEDGWKWISAKNPCDSSWYVPPSSLHADKEDKHAWRTWVRGIDYFVKDEEMVDYVKMKEGVGLSEEEYNRKIMAAMDTFSTKSRPKRSAKPNVRKPAAFKKSAPHKKNSQQKPKKAATAPKNKKISKSAAPSVQVPKLKLPTEKQAEVSKDPSHAPPRAAKKNAAKKITNKRTKDTKSSSMRKKRKTEDIDVRFYGNFNAAPWVLNPLSSHVHTVLMDVGFTWTSSSGYYLPGESTKSFTKRFTSTHEVIQYCMKGNVDFSACTPEARAPMERLMAYVNVPEKQSTWRNVRAITTKETIAFLNLLGYRALADGSSWKVTEDMVKILGQERFASFDELLLALRRSDTLIPKAKRGRRGPMDNVLRRDQMLALRLRIAEGLSDDEASVEGLGDNEASEELSSELSSTEPSSESSSEEETVADMVSKYKTSSSLPAKKAGKSKQQVSKKVASESSEQDNVAPTQSKTKKPSCVPAKKAIRSKPVTKKAATRPLSQLAKSGDDTTSIEAAVANLRASQISSQRGWQLLQRLGCSWSSGYALPRSSEKFSNQNDLVEYILKKSVLELDFLKDPLSKVELQELHRHLKFQFVSLKCGENIAKALNSMDDSDKIVAILEKIGFKRKGNGCFEHQHSEEDFDLNQIINLIRSQREDLMLICQDVESRRSREKKTLAEEDDYLLRIWAAESQIPLQFFDEDTNCKEALEALEEDQEEMDEDEEEMVNGSEEIKKSSQHSSNDGDKVLEIEEAEASNTGFIDQSSRNHDSNELLSRSTVPVSRKTNTERAETMQPYSESDPCNPYASMQQDCGFEQLMTQSRDSASNGMEHGGSFGEQMPLMTQQGDESEDENDYTASSASLFDKAISPLEGRNYSHRETAMGDAAMEDVNESAEAGGIDENGRSEEFGILVDQMDEESSLQLMDEDGGRGPSKTNPMPLMTQLEED